MGAILEQLELNATFFYQLIIFAALFFLLSPIYFRPFLRLIDARHKSTVADRETAEALSQQAEAKLAEYKAQIATARHAMKAEMDASIAAGKAEEARVLGAAREQARKTTQEAAESVARQRETLAKQLEVDVESLALAITDKLVARRA